MPKKTAKKRPAKKTPPKKKKKTKITKKIEGEAEIEKSLTKPIKFWEAIGRRKTAVARIRLFTRGDKEILVNEKPYQQYFTGIELWEIIASPLNKMKSVERFRVLARVKGGGLHAQAEAIRHGISRALTKFNPDFRKKLKKSGFLTRDPRMRERKKFGLKRARRAPQWAKR
jgi:small subunit ribosomal protein S9